MTTCERVRDALPLALTGETLDPVLREHLAACPTCRHERERLDAELRRIREGLACLAASPFLEDAVLELARADAPPVRSGWARRAVVAAGVVATLALAGWMLARSGVLPAREPAGGTASEGGADLWVPPPASAIDFAAEDFVAFDPELLARPDRYFYSAVLRTGGVRTASSDRLLPPLPDALLRYVVVKADVIPATTDRTVTLPTRYDLGRGGLLLGADLLDALGASGLMTDGSVRIEREGRSLVTSRRGEMEVELSSPDAGGATARVLVHVTRRYSGSLLVDEPLARALSLYQFEIPGPVRFDAPTTTRAGPPAEDGARARARVRIDALGVDEVVEVQVAPPAPGGLPSPAEEGDWGLDFPGLRPGSVLVASRLRFHGPGVDAEDARSFLPTEGRDDLSGVTLEPPRTTFTAALSFRMKTRTSEAASGAGAEDHTYAVVVPTSIDLSPEHPRRALEVVPLHIEGTFPPEARVTLARVWRGKTAIPSEEGVVRTEVRKDGRISTVRLPGEAGKTLRMLLTTKDGRSTFYDVALEPPRRPKTPLRLLVRADGGVAQEGWAGSVRDHAGLVALVDHFRDAVRRSGGLAPEGEARLVLELRVEEGAPWRYVQWILAAAATPDVAIVGFHLAAAGDAAPGPAYRLPKDRERAPPPQIGQDRTLLVVKLLRKTPDDPLRVVATNGATGSELRWRPGAEGAGVRQGLETVLRERRPAQVELKAPRPNALTFGDVRPTLEALDALGQRDVLIEGAPPP